MPALYFNFNTRENDFTIPPEAVLPRTYLQHFEKILSNPASTWAMHNAKFDLAMLSREGLRLAGQVHDTEVIARVLDSSHQSYSLENCLKRLAKETGSDLYEKDDRVKAWITKNKAYTETSVPGKKGKQRNLQFYKVPFEIIVPYAEMDAIATLRLAEHQCKRINATKDYRRVARQERSLTPVCFRMEEFGIKIDRSYTEAALSFEKAAIDKLNEDFEQQTGKRFLDSNLYLSAVFSELGYEAKKTAKGNASFDDAALAEIDHPLAKTVCKIRESYKKCSTYYSTFLYMADKTDRIHPNMKQGGTTTGRFSYWEPNLQNVPKEENLEEPWLVRRCFVPDKGKCFVMLDFDQMEYRMMLDQAEESKVIHRILNLGEDVHEATAQMLGITRKQAKTVNFMLLYGGGVEKLAKSLAITVPEAAKIRESYFYHLPNVSKWIKATIAISRVNGYVENWNSRKCPIEKDFAYKAPNWLIQGGCADVVKRAMLQIDTLLSDKKSKMILQVHDELLFEMPPDEFYLINDLKKIMESQYPYKKLPLTVSTDHSWKSWADKVKGSPSEETRNAVQGKDSSQAQGPA